MRKNALLLALTLCVLLIAASCGKNINSATQPDISEKTLDNIVPEASALETSTENEPSAEESTYQMTAVSVKTTYATPQNNFSDDSYGNFDVSVSAEPVSESVESTEIRQSVTAVIRISDGNVAFGFENEMLERVNKERAAYGLSALTLDKQLCYDAQLRAYEISTVNSETKESNFSHTRPDGSECFTAFYNQYMTASENIAMGTWGYYNTQVIMDGWMNSAGHRANILNEKINKAGFGCYHVGNNGYWVQLFTD